MGGGLRVNFNKNETGGDSLFIDEAHNKPSKKYVQRS